MKRTFPSRIRKLGWNIWPQILQQFLITVETLYAYVMRIRPGMGIENLWFETVAKMDLSTKHLNFLGEEMRISLVCC